LIAEKIKEISSSETFVRESIEMGFEKANSFSWQKTYDDTKEFYKDIG
jgi:hypothetical protein